MMSIATPALADVLGGQNTSSTNGDNNALGRCGPGDDWKWLGDVRTPECLAHDLAVRDGKENGDPAWLAHLKALPLLPGAVTSYFRGLVFGS